MCGVKKKYFNLLTVLIVIYYIGYIILLYYFNVLNVKIKPLMLGVL